ncbi:MAG: DUF4105 domain-containing protein [Cytophagales bacterium]|nr:DUF4105 domain-containing protein [Cytophagales bacterium]
MKRLASSFLVIALSGSLGSAQPWPHLSDSAKFSLITLSPGQELYQAFGHSAIRLRDPLRDVDILYNYGIFDFSTEYFYLKFSTGRLRYQLGMSHFERVQRYMPMEDQTVIEQIFDLDKEARQALFEFLETNYLEENRYYYYRFFEDNCATRIRDVLDTVLADALVWDFDINHDPASYRELYHEDLTHRQWEAAGLDLLLGSRIDKKKDPWHFMYKPNYLHDLVGRAPSKNPRRHPTAGGQGASALPPARTSGSRPGIHSYALGLARAGAAGAVAGAARPS